MTKDDPATDTILTESSILIPIPSTLDNDPIIKELVERKCNLQNAESSSKSSVYSVESIRKETDLLSHDVENMFVIHREANKLKSNEYMSKLDTKFQELRGTYDNTNSEKAGATSSTAFNLRQFAEMRRNEVIQKRLNDNK